MADGPGRGDITATFAADLVARQFPRWAHLPVRPVEAPGWDNFTFRLGETMSVRLPSHVSYVAQVQKEHIWLPRLAAHLPLPIPTPLAKGEPTESYPWPWSVYAWLPGESANIAPIGDPVRFARDVAGFLKALQAVDAKDGPAAGAHSHNRGAGLTAFDAQTRQAIAALGGRIDRDLALRQWDAALAARFDGPPVWVHGDIASGNLLVEDGSLSAVIDFGCSAVGDPACDLVIAWTLFEEEARAAFQSALHLDHGTWARGVGWALWKGLIVMAAPEAEKHGHAEVARRTLAALKLL